jgi:hypothetical protein
VVVGFDGVQAEDGLNDRGGAAAAAAQLGQMFQPLSVATARSPMPRIRAGERLTCLCRRDSRRWGV